MATINRANDLNKSPLSENKEETINIYFGVFFDGTENNKIQALLGELKRGSIEEKNINEVEELSLQDLMKKEYENQIELIDEQYQKEYENFESTYHRYYASDESNYVASCRLKSLQTQKEALEKKKTEVNKKNRETLIKEYYKNEDTQKNDRSNIALLEPHYKGADNATYNYRIYVEGVATYANPDKPETTTLGGGFGASENGIINKVSSAIRLIQKKINQGDDNKKLHFDVFGFSRGAAAARNFVWKVLENNALSSVIKKENIFVDFVGLYDTVSSYGAHMMDEFGFGGKNMSDVKPLHLDSIKNKNVTSVFHICAADEFRLNFNLTNIKSAIKAHKGTEIFIPGAHSDVGGGYAEGIHAIKIEKCYKCYKGIYGQIPYKIPYKISYTLNNNGNLKSAMGESFLTPDGKVNFVNLSVESYKKLGWIDEQAKQIHKMNSIEQNIPAFFDDDYHIAFSNYVKKGYSFISLKLMMEFKDIEDRFKPINERFKIPTETKDNNVNLNNVYDTIHRNIRKNETTYIYKEFEKNNELYKKLRSNYLHHSADVTRNSAEIPGLKKKSYPRNYPRYIKGQLRRFEIDG